MSQCGAKVSYIRINEKKIPNQIKVKDIKAHNPDVIWILTPFYILYNVIPRETLDYVRSRKIKIISYTHVMPSVPYFQQLDVYGKIDILFIHCKEANIFFNKHKINSFYVPLGFYPHQYFKTISEKKKYDITFMGSAFDNLPISEDKRTVYLQSLKNYNIRVFGKKFKKRLKKIVVRGYRGHEVERITYGKTKINLGLPFSLGNSKCYKNKTYLKNRFFEIPATGNFLLTCKNPDFLEIFDESAVGYYDNSVESLKENVNKYLKDKTLREKMAERAYKLVHAKHTYLHRFKAMFKILNEAV